MLVSWAGSEYVQYVCMYETVLDNCVCVSDTCSWNTHRLTGTACGVTACGGTNRRGKENTHRRGRKRRKRKNYKGDHLMKANLHRPMT